MGPLQRQKLKSLLNCLVFLDLLNGAAGVNNAMDPVKSTLVVFNDDAVAPAHTLTFRGETYIAGIFLRKE